MTSFRNKSTKLKYITTSCTLGELHKNYIEKIEKNTSEISKKQQQLNYLKIDLQNIEISGKIRSTEDIKKRANMRTEIKILEEQIRNDSSNNEILEYVSKTGDLLIDYFKTNINPNNTISEESESEKESEIQTLQLTESPQGIYISDKLKYLNQLSQKTRKFKKPVRKRRIEQHTQQSKSILDFFDDTKNKAHNNDNDNNDNDNANINTQIAINAKTINKASLHDKYLALTDKNYICNKINITKVIYCSLCKIEKTLFQSDGCYICKKCGEAEHIIMESEIINHKESINEHKQKYPYKKKNHLKEKLNQFQSKESADVPDYICDIVRNDLSKRRIKFSSCIPRDIRSILKKHTLTKYYEHVQQIYCKISGAEPITLSRDIEEKIINMFDVMQDAFIKYCPKDRSNFLSYAYVLNKIFKILNMEEHAKYFSLLKSKDKLRTQDAIWKKICNDMNWTFYPSL